MEDQLPSDFAEDYWESDDPHALPTAPNFVEDYWESDDLYAPPTVPIDPTGVRSAAEQSGLASERPLFRVRAFQAAGRIGLGMAALILLAFGGGTIAKLLKAGEPQPDGIPPWMHQRWIARMTCVLALAVIAAVMSWGLCRLRNWAKWLFTFAAALPTLLLLWSWIIASRMGNNAPPADLEPSGMVYVVLISILIASPVLYLMWSPRGAMVFSPERSESIARMSPNHLGCAGILGGLGISVILFISFTLLAFSVLAVLVSAGIIRST